MIYSESSLEQLKEKLLGAGVAYNLPQLEITDNPEFKQLTEDEKRERAVKKLVNPNDEEFEQSEIVWKRQRTIYPSYGLVVNVLPKNNSGRFVEILDSESQIIHSVPIQAIIHIMMLPSNELP